MTVVGDVHQLAAEVKGRAREMGFDLVGIAPARPSAYREYLREWLDAGQAGGMGWMGKRFEERTDPAVYLSGARSVVCVAMNYYVPLEGQEPRGHNGREGRREGGEFREEASGGGAALETGEGGAPNPHPSPLPEYRERGQEGEEGEGDAVPLRGKVARYALGGDYHQIIKDKLYLLADWIRSVSPGAETRVAVDTGPVMEKELAQLAGVGWVGKNTCLINERIGSWVLLGEVITTVELPFDRPGVDRCGTCRRCIEACPTGAITGPYQLDARKCISYLTIEHREEIAGELRPMVGEWVYGCDICQDVCPWNGRAPVATLPELQPRFKSGTLDVGEVLRWGVEDYRRELKGSAMKRVKLPVLQRNARIVEENLRERR